MKTLEEDTAWNYFDSGTLSIELLMNEQLQKYYFRCKDKVTASLPVQGNSSQNQILQQCGNASTTGTKVTALLQGQGETQTPIAAFSALCKRQKMSTSSKCFESFLQMHFSSSGCGALRK